MHNLLNRSPGGMAWDGKIKSSTSAKLYIAHALIFYMLSIILAYHISTCPTDPWGAGSWDDIAAVLLGLKLSNPLFSLTPMWTMYMSRSYYLISQAGCNRCDLLCSTLFQL